MDIITATSVATGRALPLVAARLREATGTWHRQAATSPKNVLQQVECALTTIGADATTLRLVPLGEAAV